MIYFTLLIYLDQLHLDLKEKSEVQSGIGGGEHVGKPTIGFALGIQTTQGLA